MAKIQLSGLPETTSSENTDLFHVSKSGVDYRTTRENILLSLAESVDAVDGDSISLGWADTQIITTASAANASVTIPDGDHLGQQLTLSSQGSYLTTYTHDDFSYGIIVDANHSPILRWVGDGVGGFKWDVGSQITADYEDGNGDSICLFSNRKAELIISKLGTTTTTGVSNAYGTTSGQTYLLTEPDTLFPIEFLTTPYVITDGNQGDIGRVVRVYNITATQYDIRYFSPASLQNVIGTLLVKGYYA